MTDPHPSQQNAPLDDDLRPHVFDGIQEYDKRLPRWWLVTLYGTMVFAAIYWAYYHAYQIGPSDTAAIEKTMAENAERAARQSGVLDDAVLWKLSKDAQVIAAGKTTFETTCAACHKPDLTGQIGPNLVDKEWIHGGKPMDSVKIITEGVQAKGMPAWGTILGKDKVKDVVAYIFSHHKEGEEVVAVPGWVPPGAAPAPAPTP